MRSPFLYSPGMPVRQYTCFALSSHSASATEMTAVLGIEPDRTAFRSSRRGEPLPVPVAHRWIVECRDRGLSLDEQIAYILERLAPQTDAIAALARRLDAEPEAGPSAVLEVVRYFNEAGQHPGHQVEPSKEEPTRKLGWHLGRDVLDFLQATGAAVDIDEYEEGS